MVHFVALVAYVFILHVWFEPHCLVLHIICRDVNHYYLSYSEMAFGWGNMQTCFVVTIVALDPTLSTNKSFVWELTIGNNNTNYILCNIHQHVPYHSIVFICMHLWLISSILKLIFPTLVHLHLLFLHPCTHLSLSSTILYGGGSLDMIHIVTSALTMSWSMMHAISSKFWHKLMFNIGKEYISIYVITYLFYWWRF